MDVRASLSDDWRAETQARLKQSQIYRALQEKCSQDPAGASVLALVDEAVYYAYQRTKLVLLHMPEFTLHDGDHLFRVLYLMERLVPQTTLEELSIPECLLLLLTAFFHDIGMAPSTTDVQEWYKFFDKRDAARPSTEETEFAQFASARPETLRKIALLRQEGEHSQAQLVQSYLVAEYIRLTHAERAKRIIDQEWSGKIVFRDIDLTPEFAHLCYSHNEDPFLLGTLDTSVVCGPDTFLCMPFIGVVLRLADVLDFDAKRTPNILFSHLAVRHPVSLAEWQKHRTIAAWSISSSLIMFVARCEHPAIECAIRRFCDLIDRELLAANIVLSRLHDNVRNPFPTYYSIELPVHVDRSKIEPKKNVRGEPVYRYRDLSFTLHKSQIVDLLMGTKLCGEPEVALRELLQNSVDACLLRASMEESWGISSYEPSLTVEFLSDGSGDKLMVEDNGIGMDQYVVDNYYSKIGSSFYMSSDFHRIQAEAGGGFRPTSRFGIGILACFMVADALSVETCRLLGPHSSGEPLKLLVEGPDSVFWIQAGSRDTPGTRTELLLRQGHPWQGLNAARLGEVVERTLPSPPFRIHVKAQGRSTPVRAFKGRAAGLVEEWCRADSVRQIAVTLSDDGAGIHGRATVVMLEKDNEPVEKVELFGRSVTIAEFGRTFFLDNELRVTQNRIEHVSDSLTITGDDVDTSPGWSSEVSSVAYISVHGFAVPMAIFPEGWIDRRGKVKLDLPFPVFLQVDFGGPSALSLNTARTEILFDDKWIVCRRNLIRNLLQEVRRAVSDPYWEKLSGIWRNASKDDQFVDVLDVFDAG